MLIFSVFLSMYYTYFYLFSGSMYFIDLWHIKEKNAAAPFALSICFIYFIHIFCLLIYLNIIFNICILQALINGTLKEEEYCPVCGEKGHRQFECPHRSKTFKAAGSLCVLMCVSLWMHIYAFTCTRVYVCACMSMV